MLQCLRPGRDGETADAAGHLDVAVVVEGEGGDKGAIKVNFRVVPYSNICSI